MLQTSAESSVSKQRALQIKSIDLASHKNSLVCWMLTTPTFISVKSQITSRSSNFFPQVQTTTLYSHLMYFQNSPQAQTCSNRGTQITVWGSQPHKPKPTAEFAWIPVFCAVLISIIQTRFIFFNNYTFYLLTLPSPEISLLQSLRVLCVCVCVFFTI